MSGWLMPAARSSGLALGVAVALYAGPVGAQQEPDVEMLEYLGSWQTDDGSAVDPFHLEDVQDLEPDLARSDVKTGERTQKALADRLHEERRVRKPASATGTEKDPKRRDASPGGQP